MKITDETILHVARLARLQLSPDEVKRMRAHLEQMLDYVARLEELDTSNVSAMAHPAVSGLPLREDTVAPSLDRSVVLSEAPRVAESGFAVPGFIDES